MCDARVYLAKSSADANETGFPSVEGEQNKGKWMLLTAVAAIAECKNI